MGKKTRLPLRWVLVLVCLAVVALLDLPIVELLGESLPLLLCVILLWASALALTRIGRACGTSFRTDELSSEERQARRRLAGLLTTFAKVRKTQISLQNCLVETGQAVEVEEARVRANEAVGVLRVGIARERAILLSIEVHRWRDELIALLTTLEAEGSWPSARRGAVQYDKWIRTCLDQLNDTRERGHHLRSRILADKDVSDLPVASQMERLLRGGLHEASVLRGDLLKVRTDLDRFWSASYVERDPEISAHRYAELIRSHRERSSCRQSKPSVPRESETSQLQLFH